jgi:hypothetical protein
VIDEIGSDEDIIGHGGGRRLAVLPAGGCVL